MCEARVERFPGMGMACPSWVTSKTMRGDKGLSSAFFL